MHRPFFAPLALAIFCVPVVACSGSVVTQFPSIPGASDTSDDAGAGSIAVDANTSSPDANAPSEVTPDSNVAPVDASAAPSGTLSIFTGTVATFPAGATNPAPHLIRDAILAPDLSIYFTTGESIDRFVLRAATPQQVGTVGENLVGLAVDSTLQLIVRDEEEGTLPHSGPGFYSSSLNAAPLTFTPIASASTPSPSRTYGLCIALNGHFQFADGNTIYDLDGATKKLTTIATLSFDVQRLEHDPAGNLYALIGQTVTEIDRTTHATTVVVTDLDSDFGYFAVDGNGHIFSSNSNLGIVEEHTIATGKTRTLAGVSGMHGNQFGALPGLLQFPSAILFVGNGALLVFDDVGQVVVAIVP
jgi:hypothetical protein